MSFDNVERPAHYASGKIEVIHAIEDWKLPYHLGNVVKYIARAGKKDKSKEVEDLKKARWYLDRQIELLMERKPDTTHALDSRKYCMGKDHVWMDNLVAGYNHRVRCFNCPAEKEV